MKKALFKVSVYLLLVLVSFTTTQTVFAASTDVSIKWTTLCPPPSTVCPEFALRDDVYFYGEANQNDLIELDIVIHNPTQQNLSSTQTWLSYNTDHLEGVSIETYSDFDLVAPGEKEFDRENGRAMIGVASTQGGTTKPEIVVASITFKVITASKLNTQIEFYDHRLSELGHTNINVLEGGFPVNVLSEAPKPLQITLNGGRLVGGPPPTTTFEPVEVPRITLGRPTGLKVDTGDGYAHLIWDFDNNSTLAGYNVYYSMTSGRYLHRKQLGLIDEYYVTGLLNDETYFFAITAVDINGNETDYSDEVAITINHPETSTSPFALGANVFADQLGQGADTGPATTMIIILAVLSGLGGFLFTNRQQLIQK